MIFFALNSASGADPSSSRTSGRRTDYTSLALSILLFTALAQVTGLCKPPDTPRAIVVTPSFGEIGQLVKVMIVVTPCAGLSLESLTLVPPDNGGLKITSGSIDQSKCSKEAVVTISPKAKPGEVLLGWKGADLPPASFDVVRRECSTEKVNGDCTIIIDRRFPMSLPTLQMRHGTKLTVIVVKPLPFESLTLDPQPQGGSYSAGTDQSAGLVTSAVPYLKGFEATIGTNPSLIMLNETEIKALKKPNPDDIVTNNLKAMSDRIDSVYSRLKTFIDSSTSVSLQIQEVLSPVPRPLITGASLESALRARGIPVGTPNPWDQYASWRDWLLCEFVGMECPSASGPPFRDLLAEAGKLQSDLKPSDDKPPKYPIFDRAAFDANAKVVQVLDQSNPTLKKLLDREQVLLDSLPSLATNFPPVANNLQSYFINIRQANDAVSDHQNLGDIGESKSASRGNTAASKSLGGSIPFAVNAVNEVGTSIVLATSSPSSKKAVVPITVLYADPAFEASAGALFSTLPNRSFANQTMVTQNLNALPTLGNVVITQSIAHPTVVPFVAGNYRLLPAFLWPGGRRGALYFTGSIGLNPNNSLAEFGVGPSISWRSLMFSALYNWGHDVRLTQGEYVGEAWCSQSGMGSAKCSGTPPSPSTEKYWRGTFAIGISVRVPTVFGGGGSSSGK